MSDQFQDRWITVVLENCRYCRQQESLRLLRKQTRTFPRLFASTGRHVQTMNLRELTQCRSMQAVAFVLKYPQIKFHISGCAKLCRQCVAVMSLTCTTWFIHSIWCPGETCDSISMVTNGNEHLKALEHEHTLRKTSTKGSGKID